MNGFEALIWRSILYIASPSWRCWTASRILPFGATCSSSSSSSSLSLSLSHWWLDVRGPLQLGQASSLLLCRGGELARLVACVLHLKLSGVAGEEGFGNWFSSWSLLCFILMCCLSPFSETLVYSHWSQENWGTVAFSTGGSTVERDCRFLRRNSSRRFAFLLWVEGLTFFLCNVGHPTVPAWQWVYLWLTLIRQSPPSHPRPCLLD